MDIQGLSPPIYFTDGGTRDWPKRSQQLYLTTFNMSIGYFLHIICLVKHGRNFSQKIEEITIPYIIPKSVWRYSFGINMHLHMHRMHNAYLTYIFHILDFQFNMGNSMINYAIQDRYMGKNNFPMPYNNAIILMLIKKFSIRNIWKILAVLWDLERLLKKRMPCKLRMNVRYVSFKKVDPWSKWPQLIERTGKQKCLTKLYLNLVNRHNAVQGVRPLELQKNDTTTYTKVI